MDPIDYDPQLDRSLAHWEAMLAAGCTDRRGFLKAVRSLGLAALPAAALADQTAANAATQRYNNRHLEASYDYIVCGAGSAGCVVARRLAENPAVRVLLLEAGGSDAVPSVLDPSIWFTNLGTERMWNFSAQPQPATHDRTLPLPMGRVIGGGSSVNALIYARGHRADFDEWAQLTGDPRWGYASALATFKRIEAAAAC
jgi:choline dehydrogenase